MNNYTNSFLAFVSAYNQEFNIIQPKLQEVANNYFNDFSVLLKQSYIDVLAKFPQYQISLESLLKSLFLDTKSELYKKSLTKLKSFSFEEYLIIYVTTGNEFIRKIKLPETDTFEKKMKIAQPVLDIWQKYMQSINTFNEIVTETTTEFKNSHY